MSLTFSTSLLTESSSSAILASSTIDALKCSACRCQMSPLLSLRPSSACSFVGFSDSWWSKFVDWRNAPLLNRYVCIVNYRFSKVRGWQGHLESRDQMLQMHVCGRSLLQVSQLAMRQRSNAWRFHFDLTNHASWVLVFDSSLLKWYQQLNVSSRKVLCWSHSGHLNYSNRIVGFTDIGVIFLNSSSSFDTPALGVLVPLLPPVPKRSSWVWQVTSQIS